MSAPSLLAAEAPACCEDERWKPVPDWPHESSTCGQIRSIDRLDASGMLRLGQMLPQYEDERPGKGYVYAVLLDGKRRRKVHVAVAVLEAHRGLRPGPGWEASHIYGIRDDNHLAGLAWETRAQNLARIAQHAAERAVTDTCPVTVALSQEGRSPWWRLTPCLSRPSVTSARFFGTGSFPFPFPFRPIPPSVNPCPSPVRSSPSPRRAA